MWLIIYIYFIYFEYFELWNDIFQNKSQIL